MIDLFFHEYGWDLETFRDLPVGLTDPLATAAIRRRKHDLIQQIVTYHTAKPKEMLDKLLREAGSMKITDKKQPSAQELFNAMTETGFQQVSE